VIHINQLTVDDAVDFIVQAAGRECFKTTVEAQQKIQDLALACRVKASLAEDECVDIAVTSEFGNVMVYTKQDDRRAHRLEEKLKPLAKGLPEINHLELRAGQPFPPEAC
ncbi:MAG: cytidylate kinase-like family protein, partial [Proteobacteria bacterium]|nr:cytidylate kinase-like family protein [Pseudomonadota bacterium]